MHPALPREPALCRGTSPPLVFIAIITGLEFENLGLLCHLHTQDAEPYFHSSSAQLIATHSKQGTYILVSFFTHIFRFLKTKPAGLFASY